MHYYIDTCIWRDYWENRIDNLKPLGEFAWKFFISLKDDDVVLYSDIVVHELLKQYPQNIVKEIMGIVGELLLKVDITDADIKLSKTLSIHSSDALHIVLAVSNNAILVTRDNELLTFDVARRPEELI